MKYLAYIILIGSLFACSSKTKVPKNILSQQEMNLVMWDLMRADEYTETYIMKDSSLNKKAETQKLYNQIFSLHGISNEKFQTSINFYQLSEPHRKPCFARCQFWIIELINTPPEPPYSNTSRGHQRFYATSCITLPGRKHLGLAG